MSTFFINKGNYMKLREYILSLSQFYRVNIRTAVNASELGLNGMHVRCLHVIANTPDCTANCIVKNSGLGETPIYCDPVHIYM